MAFQDVQNIKIKKKKKIPEPFLQVVPFYLHYPQSLLEEARAAQADQSQVIVGSMSVALVAPSCS